MKFGRTQKIFFGASLALVVLFASASLPAGSVMAQDRDHRWDRDRDRDHDRDRDRDRDWRRDNDRNRDRDWRDNRDRNRNVYVNPRNYPTYRSYPGYGTYRGGNAASFGEQNGYRDGFEKGADDARHNRRFNPTGSGRYRDGDHGYHSQFGSKDSYRWAYRNAFVRGYESGFRQNDRYRRW